MMGQQQKEIAQINKEEEWRMQKRTKSSQGKKRDYSKSREKIPLYNSFAALRTSEGSSMDRYSGVSEYEEIESSKEL